MGAYMTTESDADESELSSGVDEHLPQGFVDRWAAKGKNKGVGLGSGGWAPKGNSKGQTSKDKKLKKQIYRKKTNDGTGRGSGGPGCGHGGGGGGSGSSAGGGGTITA
jgi:hypothetical protein